MSQPKGEALTSEMGRKIVFNFYAAELRCPM